MEIPRQWFLRSFPFIFFSGCHRWSWYLGGPTQSLEHVPGWWLSWSFQIFIGTTQFSQESGPPLLRSHHQGQPLQHTWWGLGPAVQLQNLSKGIVLPSSWKVRATYSTPIPLELGVCQLSCWGSLQGAGQALWCLGHPGQLSQDPWEYSSRGHHQRSWHSPIDPVMTLNYSMGSHIIMAFARSSGH